jgi:hypothetical protein
MREGFYDNGMNDMQGFNAIQKDLCQGFSGVNSNMNQGFDMVSAQMAQLGYQQQNCCCDIERSIDNVRAENYKNTCEITNAIHSEGEQTRALINANVMQELRDRLADRDRDLLTANFQLSQQAQSANIIGTLRPFPQPAYITCSPYESVYGNGCARANTGCGI